MIENSTTPYVMIKMATLYLISGRDKASAAAIPPRSPPQINTGTAPLAKVSQRDKIAIGMMT